MSTSLPSIPLQVAVNANWPTVRPASALGQELFDLACAMNLLLSPPSLNPIYAAASPRKDTACR